RLALGIALAAVVYLYATAVLQQRDFIAKFHDEHMHLIQMQMLSIGRLWMPPHPLADFFDTFHILVRPVYASIYFPGTALMYVAGVWLNLPPWVMPLAVAGATVGLLYRVVSELIDGVAGLLAVLLLLSLPAFRFQSLVLMSHGVIMVLGLAIVWAYLHWRRTRALRWAAVLGALCGWAAITRPFDAIAYVTPVAVAVLLGLRAMNVRRAAATIALVIAAAAPFVALQLVENVGVTGRLFQTPYQLYAEQDSPRLQVGFSDPAATTRPLQSQLVQKQEFYDKFLSPEIQRHRVANVLDTLVRTRVPRVAAATLVSALVIILLPAFVLARAARPAAVVWAMLPIYLLLYMTFPFMLEHYVIVAAPAVIVLALLGVRGIVESFASPRAQGMAEVFLTVAIAGIAIPPLNPAILDDGFDRSIMMFAKRDMPRVAPAPSIVLFTYKPGGNFHEEPVYNSDVPWPDDAPIIRAHDLGPERNRQLFEYYAQRQPGRTVFRFDRATGKLYRLGNVVDLARQPQTQPTP
ncbi:MAG: hypothetical protein QOF78_2828, partial [Phycisphaerales bacterium]|nr:hypothetical protein [Phycisphaerales bacterium]